MECKFCKKTFSRSDAVLRHSRVCRSRNLELMPRPRKRGKKRSACDNCARAKLYCDADFPCETCLANQRQCTYKRLERSPTTPTPKASNDSDGGTGSSSQRNTSPHNYVSELMGKSEHQDAIPFLTRYNNPDIKSLPEVFQGISLGDNNYKDGNNPQTNDAEKTGDDLPPNSMFPRYSFAGLLLGLSSNPIDDNDEWIQENASSSITTTHDRYTGYHPSTPERHDQFVRELTGVWHELASRAPDDGFQEISRTQALELLDASNIPQLITIYFEQWHPHSPVVHPALIDPNKTSFPVLLAIIIIGALYSCDERMIQTARGLIPVAEEWVWRSQLFMELSTPSSIPKSGLASTDFITKFEAVQAAFIILKILLREGDKDKTHYVRTVVFDRIVKATRNLSLLQTKSPIKTLSSSNLDDSQWREICLAETQIRLACGIFNHDVSFTLFNAIPPRLLVSELQFDMPCSTLVFDSRTPQECSEFILAESRPNIPPAASLIEIYCGHEWDSHEAIIVPELTVLHHFVILSGLLQTWITRNCRSNGMTPDLMRTALDRWKIGWEICTGPLAPEDLRRVGFVRFAAIELWYLAKRMVDDVTPQTDSIE